MMMSRFSWVQGARLFVALCFTLWLSTACSRAHNPYDELALLSTEQKYERLMQEYDYAELYKLTMQSACEWAKQNKPNEVIPLCFKNISKVPNAELNQAALPYLKAYVSKENLDFWIVFYSKKENKEVERKSAINPDLVSDREYAAFDAIDRAIWSELNRFSSDNAMNTELGRISLQYLTEYP